MKHGARFVDETGNTYGRLKVVHQDGVNKHGKVWWLCQCSCGSAPIHILGSQLRSGVIKSCKCLRIETIKAQSTETHGHAKGGVVSSIYKSWQSMILRCTNSKHKSYPCYGGATPPVKIHSAWMSFEEFLQDLGNKPTGTQLGRLLDLGDYTPGNCFWMTQLEQNVNRRNHNSLRKMGLLN